jgi:hypothetical protein
MSVSLGTSPCSSTGVVGKPSEDGLLMARAKVPGPRDALWLTCLAIAIAPVILLFSPIRRMRDLVPEGS